MRVRIFVSWVRLLRCCAPAFAALIIASVGCGGPRAIVPVDRPAVPAPVLASPIPLYDDDAPALHKAIIDSDLERVKALLKSELAIDVRDSRGRTALDLAAELGRTPMVALLIDRGADPLPATKSMPLFVAALRGNRTVVTSIAAAPDPQGGGRLDGSDLETLVDTSIKIGSRLRALEAAYGLAFSRATFHLLVAGAYSRADRRGLTRGYYLDAAKSYDSAASELSARAERAASDQRTRVLLAALGNVALPMLAGAAAQSQANMMASQTGSFGVGVVTYPVLSLPVSGDFGAHYSNMAHISRLSAEQIYQIISCQEEMRTAADRDRCRNQEAQITVQHKGVAGGADE